MDSVYALENGQAGLIVRSNSFSTQFGLIHQQRSLQYVSYTFNG